MDRGRRGSDERLRVDGEMVKGEWDGDEQLSESILLALRSDGTERASSRGNRRGRMFGAGPQDGGGR
jgi:hypothetical protein